MRNVEADEGARQSRKPQFALQLVHGVCRAFVRFECGEFELFEQMTRVLVCEIDERTARTALRDTNARPFERCFEGLAILEIERH